MRRNILVVFLVFTCLYAQETLTNESILKLVKAGLAEDVIAGMIANQAANYRTDTDAVIALKGAGVSDNIIAAMIAKGARSGGALSQEVRAPSAELVIHDATPVRLRLSRNLSSADAKIGQTVDFEVLDELAVDDVPVVARGATAIATVTDAEPKKRMARGGKVNVNIDYVRIVNGDKLPLRGVKESAGGGHTGAMTGGMVVTALVFWPAAPFFLFIHGKDVTIPKGTEVTAYTDGELRVDPQKLVGH